MSDDFLRPLLGVMAITAAVLGAVIVTTSRAMTALTIELVLLAVMSVVCWYSATALVSPHATRARSRRR